MLLANLRAGEALVADSGFECLPEGAIREIKADEAGDLFIDCGCGRHYLVCNANAAGHLIGLGSPRKVPLY